MRRLLSLSTPKQIFNVRGTRNEATTMKTKHNLRHIDRCFDIDEATSETSSQSNARRVPLEYGKRVDAHRLAAVSAGGGWWNPTTQELLPILPEDHPDYRQNEEVIAAAIRRWNGGTSRLSTRKPWPPTPPRVLSQPNVCDGIAGGNAITAAPARTGTVAVCVHIGT